LLLGVAAVGVGFVATIFQIVKGLFETSVDKRALYLTDRDDYWRNKDWDYWRDRNDWKNQTNENFRYQSQNNNYPNYITPLSQIPTNNPAGIYSASTKDLSVQNYKQFLPDFFDVIVVDKKHSGNIVNSKEWQEPLEYFKGATQIAVTLQEKISVSDVDYFGTPIIIDTAKQISESSFSAYNHTSKENSINHTTNNSQIENNTNISTNNNTIVNNSISNNYVDEGDTIINKTENYYTQINHNKNNKITINNTVMARQTSFSHQIELAEELRKYLHGFQERLGDVAQNYKNKCNDLFEAGMMDETFEDFEQNYMQETISKVANVVEQINERDIPFIEKYIADLEELRSKHGK
jgi:type I site-specific restriction endonuclease